MSEYKKNIKTGFPPRGFYFEKGKVDILVVGKNPGHLLENSDEHKLYSNKKSHELFDTWIKFRKDYFKDHKSNKARSSRFHKNLYKYLNHFIGKNKNIFDHIAETNLVKCSNKKREQDVLNSKTINECYDKYLLNEINLFKPKVILALGREVEKHLNKKINVDFNCKIIYVKHPSYSYKKENEIQILDDIKKQIDKALK